MSRRYPNRRRRRNVRPPPNRYRGADSPARSVPGLRAEVSVDWVLTQLGVRNQRQMFNRAATGSIWVTAASCAVVGASMAAGAGAIVGGLLGLMLADHVFCNYRFIR